MWIEHASHEIVLWELIVDLKKLSYEDSLRISWSCVMRIDHIDDEVELWGSIMDLMKFSDED